MAVLECKSITKYFPGIAALQNVDVVFNKGEIHCVIGENGAGKSTLIKCLIGLHSPERGKVLIDGQDTVQNRNLFKKIAYVPQEIDLFENLTVAENLFLPYTGKERKSIINKKAIEKKAVPILEKFHLHVRPNDLVKNISVSQQQFLQIARALTKTDCEVLLMDEPTTSLTTQDADLLFDIIRAIKNENKAIVFISHKLEEIFKIGDVISVFRNGEKVAFSSIADIDVPWIIKKMTGKEIIQNISYKSEKVSKKEILKVSHLSGARFTDISFTLHAGEILGFAGLVGSGRSETMQAMFGYLPVYKGSVEVDGKKWEKEDAAYAVSNGMVYLPEERKSQGILPLMSVKENISFLVLKKLTEKGVISAIRENELAENVIEKYNIKTPSLKQQIKFLSGGNQQKAIIGRSMCCNPKILIIDEPTKGIDVGTKDEIYRLMKQTAEDEGIGIILISSELEEVLKCSNRIITLYEGKVTGEFSNPEKEEVVSAMIGMKMGA